MLGLVCYGISLLRWSQSSAFSFALLIALAALSLSEPILHFEVGKAIGRV